MSTSPPAVRRAQPPRPSLLVGDVQACRLAWVTLKPQALAALQEQRLALDTGRQAVQGPVTQQEWDSLVRRLRSLRESLVSERVLDLNPEFTLQVYEVSVDVCAAAANYPEFTKCLSRLVHEVYPCLEVQQQQAQVQAQQQQEQTQVQQTEQADPQTKQKQQEQQQQEQEEQQGQRQLQEEEGAAGSCAPQTEAAIAGSSERGLADAAATTARTAAAAPAPGASLPAMATGLLQRRPEMVAAHLLCYACLPGGRSKLAVNDALRTWGWPFLAHRAVQFALAALRALALSDFITLAQLHDTAEWPLLKSLLGSRLGEERAWAMRIMAASYHQLPIAAIQMMLLLGPSPDPVAKLQQPVAGHSDARDDVHPAVLQVLQAAAAEGSKGAACALQTLQSSQTPANVLHFKS